MKYKNKFWKYFTVGCNCWTFCLAFSRIYVRKKLMLKVVLPLEISSNTLSPVNSAWTLTVQIKPTVALALPSNYFSWVDSGRFFCLWWWWWRPHYSRRRFRFNGTDILKLHWPNVTATDNSALIQPMSQLTTILQTMTILLLASFRSYRPWGPSQVEFTTGVADSNNNIPFRDSDGSLSTLADGVFYTDSGRFIYET